MTQVYGASVVEFGATGDGETDDAPAVQAALDSGASRVVVPSGNYLLGQGIRIGSNTHLIAHPHAIFRFADGAGGGVDDFLLTNKDHAGGDRSIRIEGGVWDGNNPGNPRGPDEPDSYTGVSVNFVNVDGLIFRDTTLMDAESYFVRLGKVSNFLIEDIAFEIRTLRPNQDGIHISGFCSDGIVRRIRGLGSRTPNDDMVALLADDALHRAQNLNGAFNGPIHRVRVEHLRASSCHSFIRLLSVDNPIEDVEITDVAGGCICSAINMDGCRDCRVPLFVEADRPDGVGSITNVRIADFNVYKASDHSRQPLIDFRTRADDFRIERFRRDASRDSSPASATLCIEKSGDMDVSVEGLSRTQAGDHAQPIAMADGVERYRTDPRVTQEEGYDLQEGGFDALTVTSATSR